MTQRTNALTSKKATTPLASEFLRRAGVRSVPDFNVPSVTQETSFGQDLSQVPALTEVPTAHVAEQTASCPVFPRTRPFGGAGHICSPPVQAKLKIGQPGDKYEQEADRVAEAMMQMPGKSKAIPTDDKGPPNTEISDEAFTELEVGPEDETEEDILAPDNTAELEEEKSHTKEKVEFQVIPNEVFNTKEIIGKTKFVVRKSTPAQRAAMSASTYGITSPDPLKVVTRTYRHGANWRLRVRKVISVIRTFSRLLAGQKTPTVTNSTAADFCPQVTELDKLGNAPPNAKWYMLGAVKAHERVHIKEWKTSMGSNWPAQRTIIQGLNVPVAGATKSRKAATANMRSSVAFRNALQTSKASGNYPAFWGIADPNVNTDAAERVIVAPRIRQLCVNARSRGWAPGGCPVCVKNGIT